MQDNLKARAIDLLLVAVLFVAQAVAASGWLQALAG